MGWASVASNWRVSQSESDLGITLGVHSVTDCSDALHFDLRKGQLARTIGVERWQ